MRKITTFTFLTLNGFYKGVNEDISWHLHEDEGNDFSEKQLKTKNILLFGRKTYELMSGFWPTKMAYDSFPIVADGMNSSEKLVISNSLTKTDWNNTKILTGDWIEQLKQLKNKEGRTITILGSGTIITQLTDHRLIDEYGFLIDPIAIGKGTPIFEGIQNKLELTLLDTQIFKQSGSILLKYGLK
jgi:dihydrofolate reductase